MLALRPRSSAVHTEDGAGRKWNVKRIRPSPMLHAPKVAIRNAIGSRALAALAALAAIAACQSTPWHVVTAAAVAMALPSVFPPPSLPSPPSPHSPGSPPSPPSPPSSSPRRPLRLCRLQRLAVAPAPRDWRGDHRAEGGAQGVGKQRA